jgi:hypothetical protein
MRLWHSFPFLGRTRIGFSVSDREIARAFRALDTPILTGAEKAAIDRRAQEFAKAWAPAVSKLILALLWGVAMGCVALVMSTITAHAGTCRVYSDGRLGIEECENGSVTMQYPDGRRVTYGEESNAGFENIRVSRKRTMSEASAAQTVSTELFLNFLGIRTDSPKAEGLRFTINLITPDNGEKFIVELENATLTNIKGFVASKPDLTITINRSDLEQTIMGTKTLEDRITDGTATWKATHVS